MKKLLLIPACLLAFNVLAQESQVHDAIDDKYGKDGRDKLNAWTENMMNAKTEPQYTFTTAMNMHIISYKHGEKKDESDIKYYINPASETFAMRPMGGKKKEENMIIVYDMKNHAMLMLDHDKMTGMAMNMNAFMSKEMQERRDHPETSGTKSNTDCKKTGQTKTIQGHLCEQFVCKDDERKTRSEIWIASDLPINIAQSGARSPYASYFKSAEGMGGMMMLANFYKEEELESTMEITMLDPKANIMVKTIDYKLNDMGGRR